MSSRSGTRALFVCEDVGRRHLQLNVDDGQLVGGVKEHVRRALLLGEDEALSGCTKRRVLSLCYAGAVLDDSWRFADLGIAAGAQVTTLLNANC